MSQSPQPGKENIISSSCEIGYRSPLTRRYRRDDHPQGAIRIQTPDSRRRRSCIERRSLSSLENLSAKRALFKDDDDQTKEGDRKWTSSDFDLAEALGMGKFGKVYRAREKESNVTVAIKVVYKGSITGRQAQLNILREIEIQTRLRHPRIMRMFGCCDDHNSLFMILEYIDGGDLFGVLSGRKEPMSLPESMFYMAQLIDATVYLHRCHVIHRDIKPENILLTRRQEVKLGDFGWSVHAPPPETMRKTVCGTPEYMCPEIVDKSSYDARADSWSVGILWIELMKMKTPFGGEDRAKKEVYEAIMRYNDQDVDRLVPMIPHHELREAWKGLLRRRIQDRNHLESLMEIRIIRDLYVEGHELVVDTAR